MADGDWDKILEFYRKNQFGKLQNDCFWMEKFITHFLKNRQVPDIYPLTSHLVLSLTVCKNYSEVRGKPHLRIQLNPGVSEYTTGKYRYDFTLIKHRSSGEVYRTSTESIFCSFEKSLEVFDEIIAKLREIS